MSVNRSTCRYALAATRMSPLSRSTVDLWLGRYATDRLAGLDAQSHAAPRQHNIIILSNTSTFWGRHTAGPRLLRLPVPPGRKRAHAAVLTVWPRPATMPR